MNWKDDDKPLFHEYTCTKCWETFLDDGDPEVEHWTREDGTPCTGLGHLSHTIINCPINAKH